MTIPQALVKLSRSKFRGRFKLDLEMRNMINENGIEAMRVFVQERVKNFLAPMIPLNDGHQTPLRGHPVFIAQHATATCCRTCLNHWWRVKKGVALDQTQQEKCVNLIMTWIEMQMNGGIEVVMSKMTEEDLKGIPFWKSHGGKFTCPYRTSHES
jgi:hypothetical protein